MGDGLKKPSREDIASRVLELIDPEKHAQKEQEKAENAKDGPADKDAAAEDAEEAEAPAPENFISTEVQTRPAPNWKNVPDGMVALYQEGCKQAPDQTLTMLCRVLRPATTVRSRRGTEERGSPRRIPLN